MTQCIYLSLFNRYYGVNDSNPMLTIVGSSNFGYRSVYRDLEAQLVIFSKNLNFRNDLNKVCLGQIFFHTFKSFFFN